MYTSTLYLAQNKQIVKMNAIKSIFFLIVSPLPVKTTERSLGKLGMAANAGRHNSLPKQQLVQVLAYPHILAYLAFSYPLS